MNENIKKFPFIVPWAFLMALTIGSYIFAESGTTVYLKIGIILLGLVKLLTVLWTFMEAWESHAFWRFGVPIIVFSVVGLWSYLLLV